MTNQELNGMVMETWKDLPWLLSRKEVLRLTGLSRHELRKLVASGVLHRHAVGAKGRYFKVEIARLCRVVE